jgi:hypothetical protein
MSAHWPVNRPLGDLKEFSTTITNDINGLPTTSPHRSYSESMQVNLGFATYPNPIRGTARAHHDKRLKLPRHS